MTETQPVSDRARRTGERIRQRRKSIPLTVGQLAAYADVSKSWLSRVERGEIEGPAMARLERVARVLGAELPELTGVIDQANQVAIWTPPEKAPVVRRLVHLLTVEQWQRLERAAGSLFVEVIEPSPGEPTDGGGTDKRERDTASADTDSNTRR